MAAVYPGSFCLSRQGCALAQGKPEFGHTRKDIILIGGGLIGFGFVMYYGLQAGGVDPLVAGNFVQLFVILGICLGYISTYFLRVANKACAGSCILRLHGVLPQREPAIDPVS